MGKLTLTRCRTWKRSSRWILSMMMLIANCAPWTTGQGITKQSVSMEGVQSVNSIAVSEAGSIYVAGTVEESIIPTKFGRSDAFIAMVTTTGQYGWYNEVGTSQADFGRAIGVSSGETHVILLGSTNGQLDPSNNPVGTDYFLSVFLPDGTEWGTKVQFGSNGLDNARFLTVLQDGSIVGGGASSLPAFSGSEVGATVFSYRLSSNRPSFVWGLQYGYRIGDTATAIAEDPAGLIYVCGNLENPEAAQSAGVDPFLLKIDPSSSVTSSERVLWEYEFDKRDSTVEAKAVSSDMNGNALLVTESWVDRFHGSTIHVTKISSRGNFLWTEKVCCDSDSFDGVAVGAAFARNWLLYVSGTESSELERPNTRDQVITYTNKVFTIDSFGTTGKTSTISDTTELRNRFRTAELNEKAKFFLWGSDEIADESGIEDAGGNLVITRTKFEVSEAQEASGEVVLLEFHFELQRKSTTRTRAEIVTYCEDIIQDELQLASRRRLIESTSEEKNNGNLIAVSMSMELIGEEDVNGRKAQIQRLFSSTKLDELVGVSGKLLSDVDDSNTGTVVQPTTSPTETPVNSTGPDTKSTSDEEGDTNQLIIIIGATAGGVVALLTAAIILVVCCCWIKPSRLKETEVVHEHGYYAGSYYQDDGGYYEDGKEQFAGVGDYNYGQTDEYQPGQNGYHHRPNTIGPY